MLEKWSLPRSICDTVKSWSNATLDAEVDSKQAKLNAIVDVSDAVAQMISMKTKRPVCSGCMCKHVHDRLGISSGEIDRMFTSCGSDFEETLQIFDLSLGKSLDCEQILEVARQQLVNLSLGLVADLTHERSTVTTLAEENRHLAKVSAIDALTGLANRMALDRELEELSKARSHNSDAHALFDHDD